jgi:archaellum component FlaC
MTTMNITRELTFEDMSVHSPGAFRKGDAMRQMRTAPTASAFREALAELDQTANSLDALVEGAKEKALGNSERDLERIKNNVKRLKFGTIELGTEAAFLRSVLESRPLPTTRAPPVESAEFKAASAEIKVLKDRNDAEAKEVARLVQEVGQSAVEFQQMHKALATRVERLEELETAAEGAEMAASGADADAAKGAADHPEDAALTLEEARAAIEALDAEAKAVHAALKTRTAEVEAMHASLAPAEARLSSTRAELGLFAGADSISKKEADAAAAIAETEATVVEQRAMVEHLTGCEIVEVKPASGDLTMRVRTAIERCPDSALEPVDGTQAAKAASLAGGAVVPGEAPSEKTHVMVVSFHRGSTAIKAVSLDPPDTPVEDIVDTARAAGCDGDALKTLAQDVKTRVAATALRAEALSRAAAQTPMEWSRVSAQVRVGLYHGTGGVAAMDVPLEWPLAGARVRVVGLAGLAPAVVAAAAQRVDPGGYDSVAAALRATQVALEAAGHVPNA